VKRVNTVVGLLVAVALGAGVGPALHGCGTGQAQFDNVFASIGFDPYRLTDEGARELRRFDDALRYYAADPANERQRKHFHDAFKRIHRTYVTDVTEADLVDAALRVIEARAADQGTLPAAEVVEVALDGVTESLDPHSAYLDPDELRESEMVTSGEFGGLGIQVTLQEGLIRVIAPLEGTPADRSGIRAGDLITQIDGMPVDGMSLKSAVNTMRGPPGTDIQLTLRREAKPAFTLTLTRAVITIEPVRWFNADGIGYVRVVAFNEKAAQRLAEGLKALREEAPRLRGLIVDLRNNPGGLLDQSVAVADAFLDRGMIVSIRGRHVASERGFVAERGDLAADLPMVVLINAGSASAAEIVAAALQDHRRAVIMGDRSFGKGSVQTVMRLPEGGALKLTTAMYYTPGGEAIQARGVVPDIRLILPTEADDAPHEADLPGAFPADRDADLAAGTAVDAAACEPVGEAQDRAIGCAVAYLRAGSTDRFLALMKDQPRL
jgi:carboxyl-terminal processing protease